MVINDDRADPAGRISKGKLRDRNADPESDLEEEFDDLRIRRSNQGGAASTRFGGTSARGGKTIGNSTQARTNTYTRGRGGSVAAQKRKASEAGAASVHSGAR